MVLLMQSAEIFVFHDGAHHDDFVGTELDDRSSHAHLNLCNQSPICTHSSTCTFASLRTVAYLHEVAYMPTVAYMHV